MRYTKANGTRLQPLVTLETKEMLNSITLNELVDVVDEKRDDIWENHFFHALSKGYLRVLSPDPQIGPDGWPYLLVETVDENGAGDSFQQVMQWLSNKGVGLVVNPTKDYPDYVFTYGMIWSFKERGLFFKKEEHPVAETFEFQSIDFKTIDVKKMGTPSEGYLPIYVRSIIKEFLIQQGVLAPKILVYSLDEKNYYLAFSIESLGQPNSSEHQGILEALSWFLPLDYKLSILSEKELSIPFSTL